MILGGVILGGMISLRPETAVMHEISRNVQQAATRRTGDAAGHRRNSATELARDGGIPKLQVTDFLRTVRS